MTNPSSSSSSSAAAHGIAVVTFIDSEKKLLAEEQQKINDELWKLLIENIEKNSNNLSEIQDIVQRQHADPNCTKLLGWGDNRTEKSPLQYATHYGKADLVDFFLTSCKVDPNQIVAHWGAVNGWSLLGYALYQDTFTDNTQWEKIIKSFLFNKASPSICAREEISGTLTEKELFLEVKAADFAWYMIPIIIIASPVAILICMSEMISASTYRKLKKRLEDYQEEIKLEADIKVLGTKLATSQASINDLNTKLMTAVAFSGNLATEVSKLKVIEKQVIALTAEKQSLETEVKQLKSTGGPTKVIQELEEQIKKKDEQIKEKDEQIADLQIGLKTQQDVNKKLYQQTPQYAASSNPSSSQSCSNATSSSQASALSTSSSVSQQQTSETKATGLPRNPLSLFSPHATTAYPVHSGSSQNLGSNPSSLFAARFGSSTTMPIATQASGASDAKNSKEEAATELKQ